MAQWKIDHPCGHESWRDLSGSRASQQWVADREAARPCRACWIATKQAKSRAEGAAALAKVAEDTRPLATLEGTVKQVEWAAQIRAKALVWVETSTDPGDLPAVLPVVRAALARIPSAAWFCDRGRVPPGRVAASAVGWWLVEARETCLSLLTTEVARVVAAEALAHHEAGDPYDVSFYGPWELVQALAAAWHGWRETLNPARERGNLTARDLYHAVIERYAELRAEVLREALRFGVDLAVSDEISPRLTRRAFNEATRRACCDCDVGTGVDR